MQASSPLRYLDNLGTRVCRRTFGLHAETRRSGERLRFCAVRARQTEIGLRMSLGAAPSSIVRLVFQRVGVLIAAGLALGLAGSVWAARFVETLLFQLEARDPVTFAGAAAVLGAVGVIAAWVPARRAARLDPATVLREG
jgi:putative ABC transport system permease protein